MDPSIVNTWSYSLDVEKLNYVVVKESKVIHSALQYIWEAATCGKNLQPVEYA